MKKKIGTIDITPDWIAIYPNLCEMIDHGSLEQKIYIKDELKRLCVLADKVKVKKETTP